MSREQGFAGIGDAIGDAPHQAASMRARVNLFLIDMATVAGRERDAIIGKPQVIRQRRDVELAAA